MTTYIPGEAPPSPDASLSGNAAAPGLPTGYTEPNFAANATPQSEEQTFMQQYENNPQLQAYVQQNYGYLGWMLQNPELAPILVGAALGQWDQGKVSGLVAQTNWYKTSSQSIRDWQALQAEDPATANQQLEDTKWQIWQISQQSGIALTPDEVQNLATQANMFGWVKYASGAVTDVTDLNQIIRNNYAGLSYNGGSNVSDQMGQSATFINQAKALQSKYLVPMSSDAMNQWATRAVKGQADIDGLENYLRQQAGALYPFMQPALNMGMTPADYLNPYTQAASQTLGVSADQIDWTNPKWMKALTTIPGGQPDQSGGAPQGIANLTQFTTNLKSDPGYGYQNTQDAMNNAYGLANTILTTFGKVKT